MALEGNLSDFSLAEMFRMLASGSKTGVLHVTGEIVSGVVCFRSGSITYADLDGTGPPLSARLATAGAVSARQLRQALGLQKIQRRDKAGRSLGMILVDEGYVEPDALDAFVREQIADALFEMLRLESGELRFEADATCDADDLGMPISVDAALADADRRLDAWKRIRERVPDLDARFVMAEGPGERSSEIRVTPREWAVLCHLHGGRSVRDIMSLADLDEFEAAEVVFQMISTGLIQRIDDAGRPIEEARA
ncbi:MAG: DUF4388 domain-containing protein [Coriobacteriales bacterium]|nr:DUF4388 domain-containing protein [Coriobacteriales bacterium]